MVDDCLAQGWITGSERYLAGPKLIDYVHQSAMQVHEILVTDLSKKSQNLINYREIRAKMVTQLSLTDSPVLLQDDTKETRQ